ncbi:MAG: tRNA (adenosine(37)-N6)-threonylcarbamoyltransferase complex transferase subunit TsaD [Phycisphaerae bacterium]|nr:tRNA (adenosine(37)-N6)-threonylcarbamoyltransferase complex transferase subunit TsaD [Phycisphaerae bacterium]
MRDIMRDKQKIVLGVESSCDETACAVVVDGVEVLCNVVASQIDQHARFGGVVPEIASRAHLEAINTVIAEALESAGVGPADISAIAVTHQPGLIGSLLVGLMAAKTLAWVWDVPLVGVNHVCAHAYAAALAADPVKYPAVALIASGGHTALYQCVGPTEMKLLGSTIDDAAGEAFDKVATILQLGYPGGPAIDIAARQGNPAAVNFPRSLLKGQSLDFSFSGLKTAVLYHVNGVPGSPLPPDGQPRGIENFSAGQVADIAASFQAAVVDTLCIKIRRAVQQTGARTIILGGGVAANSALRDGVKNLAAKLGCVLRRPEMQFCTDNAAMIAGIGYHFLQAGQTADLRLAATPTVRM